jgi:hypothetical protein
MGLQGFSVMEQKIGRIREGHFPPHSRGLAPRSSCYRNSSPPAFKRPTCPELCSPSALFWEEGLRTIPLGSSTWWRAAAFHLTVFLPAAPRLPETPRYGERQFAFLPAPYPERKRAVTSVEPTPLSPDTPSTPPIMAKTLLRIASL